MTQNNKRTNPFPGIRSYQMDEDYLFFGRESQINELISILSETRFLAIIGSSGCGKSSLVRAGLIPSLLKGRMQENPNEWNINILRPGDNPIGNMASTIYQENFAEEKNIELQEIEKLLNSDNQGLVNVFKKLNKKSIKNQLIVIDQFEELFRFKSYKTNFNTIIQASNFVNLFLNAINQSEVPIYVALSMRSDFLDDCTEYRNLTETINNGQYLVPRMTNEERKLAIEGPIQVSDGKITDRLLERLLDDVGDDPDQLPILQHSLMRTWDYWKENRVENQAIDIQHYEAIGTMSEALSFHAEEIYNEFTSQEDKVIIEKIFKALTDFGTDNRGTRRPTQISEICIIANAKEDKVINIIEKFRASGRAFIMPPYNIPINGDTTIDISHESIMRVWSRLRKWIQEETESAQLYLRLSKSSELYQKGEAGLWVNPELQVALNWYQRTKPNLSWAMRYDSAFDRAVQFLNYSRSENERIITIKEEKRKKELKRTRNFAIFLGFASVVSILFLVISLNMRFKAEAKEKEALEQKQIAVSESKQAAEQRKSSVIQKKIAEQQQQIAEQQSLLTEEQKQNAIVQKTLAEIQRQRAILAMDTAIVAKERAVKAEGLTKKALTRADSLKNEAIKAKNVALSEQQRADSLRLLAIARSVAIKSSEISKSSSGDLAALLALQALHFNKEKSGYENQPDIFNALLSATKSKNAISDIDIVKDAYMIESTNDIVSLGDDGKIRLWQKDRTGKLVSKELKNLFKNKNGIRLINHSSDFRYLTASTDDGNIIIFELKDGNATVINTFQPESTPVKGLFFVGNNKLISCFTNGNIYSTNFSGNSSLILKIGKQISTCSYNSEMNKIACGSMNGETFLISIANSELNENFDLKSKAVTSVFLTQKYIFAGLNSGDIMLIPIKGGGSIKKLIGHTSGVTQLDYNSISKQLVSSSYDGSIRIWDIENTEEQPIVIKNHNGWVNSVEFCEGGKRIISSGKDKTIKVTTIDLKVLAAMVCSSTSRNLTTEEWNKYIGNEIPFQKTCTDKP